MVETLLQARRASRGIGRTFFAMIAMAGAAGAVADAQTWEWDNVMKVPVGPALHAKSTVEVHQNSLALSYTAPIGDRQVTIASCRAALADVQSASAVRSGGRVFFLVRLKPQRSANCASGKETAAAIPGTDFAEVSRIAEAVNRAAGANAGAPATQPLPVRRQTAPASAAPTTAPRPVAIVPTPEPTPTPPRATPTPAAGTVIRIADWVETEGLFTFVRVRNTKPRAVQIVGAEVSNCRNVDFGCGAFPRVITLEPRQTVTIATVLSSQRVPATFTYRYFGALGNVPVHGGGASTRARPNRTAPMSNADMRVAEGAVIAAFHAPTAEAPKPTPPPPINLPARLIVRGTSRLAIGHSGVAKVRVTIAADGRPEEATVVSISDRRLTAAAIETAVTSTYLAAIQNGQPASSTYIATFTFSGEDPATASVPVWRRSPLPAPTASSEPATAARPPAALTVPTPSPSTSPASSPLPSPAP